MQAQDVRTIYASGTAYALTNSSAALDFGTTDPSLTLTQPGTWLIFARASLAYAAATFASSRTVTLKLRRTNNTAGDLTNASISVPTRVTSTVTDTFGPVMIPPVLYTTSNIDDAITIYADVSVAPSAGAFNATNAEIIALRLF